MITMKQFAGGMKRIGAASLDPLCKLIASVCVFSFVLIATYPFFYRLGGSYFFYLLLSAAGFFGGWITQGVVLALIRKRERQTIRRESAWESNNTYFDYRLALFSLLLWGVITLVCSGGIRQYFQLLYEQDVIKSYDAYSLQPVMTTALLYLSAVTGINIQFRPYERIINFKRFLIHSGISLMAFILSSGATVIGIYYLIYAVGAILILNQSYILRSYNAITVTKITTTARVYSARMILLWILLAAVCGAIVVFFVKGMYLLFQVILFLLVYTIVGRNQPGYTGRIAEVTHQLESSVMGNAPASGLFMLLGAVILLIFAIVLIVFARHGAVRDLLVAFNRWFKDFIAFFMGSRDADYNETAINYRDTVEAIEKVQKTVTERVIERRHFTLRDFRSELSALKTNDAKISYSYTVMIYLLTKLNPTLKRSDTPRELEKKINATLTIPQIDEITELIELLKYAEIAADDRLTQRLLERVLGVVEQRLE